MKALSKKGFTLIEFLIALVVIGFIVGLLINYFSNPLKDAAVGKAATKIADDTRTYYDAAQKYYMDNTNSEIADLTKFVTPDSGTAILNGQPVPPSNAKKDPNNASFVYELDTALTTWGTNAADVSIKLVGITADVCDKINLDNHVTKSVTTDPVATADLQCYNDGTDDIAIKPLHIH